MSEVKESLFDRIFKSGKQKTENNQSVLEESVKAKLKGLVYDDTVVEELLPVFVKLHSTEGFNTVQELLEAKEKQIEAISGGDWFKQETKPEDKKEEDTTDGVDPVDELLKQKYEESK